ncbi:unnamed protein product [Trifolium pratense]|uniref:Uncharacterized protein n=1 Tax=Trifolium pratense TaxID=57577 RepID=A0ACB0KBW1_TRIPR|nr:unnamed protein product [Trifolium pratense]
MAGKRQKITKKSTASASASSVTAAAVGNRFRSDFHQARYDSNILMRNFIPERVFDLKQFEFPEIQQNLTTRNWVYFPSVIKPVHLGVVREFYANAYLRDEEEKEFTSMVRGKVVRYDWETIDRVLQINYQGICNVSCRRRIRKDGVDYDELLNFLCRPGSAWMNCISNANPKNTENVSKRMRTKDLKPVAKAWCSFFHQTVELCSNVSELTVSQAMGVVAIMKGEEVNVSKLISDDIFGLAQHDTNFLGHAAVIVRLCEEAGVEDLLGDVILNPKRAINFDWINRYVLEEEEIQRQAEEQAQQQEQQPQPPPQQPQAEASQPPDFGDEMTDEHRAQVEKFCWMQDVCASLGIPATYLTHQTDRWAAAQRFREKNFGPPPSP